MAPPTESSVVMDRLQKAVAHVRTRTQLVPRAAIVTRAGLGPEADSLAEEVRVDLPELGGLRLGRMDGVPVALLQPTGNGEGVRALAFPIRVLGLLGAEVLALTGVCRSLDPSLNPGDLVLVDDHLNLLGDNPLIGANIAELGPRFPDMSAPYDRPLQALAREAGQAVGASLALGVYAAVPDPSRLTPAEFTKLRHLGADLVGMDVAPEVIVARHIGMRVVAMMVVAGRAQADDLTPAAVSDAGGRVTRVVRGLVERLARGSAPAPGADLSRGMG